ncbi:hypothetical protein O185_21905 [Photorhabdus temperata J3]|uniref:Uncharacterized protein n=1 Tax=Photorhabdus temperata J3 TaxID=1389415 RepID=U7QUQ1_PHOTE|nr:hypothetical protein O185_21905 [Photorhabdus temperata J3]
MFADLYVFEAVLSDGIDGSFTGVLIVDNVFIIMALKCGKRTFVLSVNILDY